MCQQKHIFDQTKLAQRLISQSRKVGKDIENESGTESRSPVKDPVGPIKRWLYHVCSSACEKILSGIRLLLRGFDNTRRNQFSVVDFKVFRPNKLARARLRFFYRFGRALTSFSTNDLTSKILPSLRPFSLLKQILSCCFPRLYCAIFYY